jgi:hypothetical protein
LPRKTLSNAPHPEPWRPPVYENGDAAAIQALAQGCADRDQQQRALAFIVYTVCGTYDMSYRPQSERDTVFAEGKRFVGAQIIKLSKLNLSALTGKETENG